MNKFFKNSIDDLDLLSPGKAGYAIIDFDETLFLENSSEYFLICAKPKVLIFVVIMCIAVVFKLKSIFVDVPPRSAEAAALRFIIRFTPWNYQWWQRKAAPLFQENENRWLREKLQKLPDERIVICSNGYEELVMPLVKGSRWEKCRLSFVPLFRNPDVFRQNKIERLAAALDAQEVKQSVFVTDSKDDLALLNHVDHPCLVTWNAAAKKYGYVPRLMPLSYTLFAKAPLPSALKKMFFDDYVIMFMALIFAAANFHFTVMAGATFLFLSLQSMYEIGYYENDFHSAKLEDKPKIRKQAALFYGSHVVARALLWSVLFAVVGCWLVGGGIKSGNQELMLRDAVKWAGVLCALYVTFKIYNKLNVKHRVNLYVLLSSIKYLGIYFIVAPTTQGVLLTVSHVIMMSSGYVVYRSGGNSFGPNDMRANFFVVFSAAYCLYNAGTISAYDLVVFAVMGCWCAIGVLLTHLHRAIR